MKFIFRLLIISLIFLITQNNGNAKQTTGPFAAFVMIHLEVGEADFSWYKNMVTHSNNKNLKYQEFLYPTLVNLVKTANKYNAKLTLCFNPQWAEYILKDRNKIVVVRQWQKQGHEIAFHHHGYNHTDWNGYSNRDDVKNDPRYRGRVEEGFSLIKELAYPDKIITGTVGDEDTDFPPEIRIQTRGGGRGNQGIKGTQSRPYRAVDRNRIYIGHGFLGGMYGQDAQLRNQQLLTEFKNAYLETPADEVFGVVTHCLDFHRDPAILENWFKFIQSQGDNVRTLRNVVKYYFEQHN